jgi:hypothetical protein
MRAASDGDHDDSDPPRLFEPGDLTARRSASLRLPDPGAAVTRFVAEAATDQAARERLRARWRHQQLVEDSTWYGILRELTARREQVTIDTAAGRRVRGELERVGLDFVGVVAGSELTLISLSGISAIRMSPGAPPALGSAGPDEESTLVEVLSELALDRPMTTWLLAGGTVLTGELVGVGRDAAMVRLVAESVTATYVPIGASTVVTVAHTAGGVV